jgi:hypothetical protein
VSGIQKRQIPEENFEFRTGLRRAESLNTRALIMLPGLSLLTESDAEYQLCPLRPEDGSSTVLRNVGILPHHSYTPCCTFMSASELHSLHPEDGGSTILRNVGNLPHR